MGNGNFKEYANSFQAIARLGLESIECLLKHLENPEKSLKFIHIAGTNGKGSVCSFLENIFSVSAYRTGKYISPNLISVSERISVDGQNIPDNELDELLSVVENAAKLVSAELGVTPTQFEIWTATAFLYFKNKGCDIVILETGLGGRRDATNIIPTPLASVITRLDLDHTEYLGDTLQKIAAEKAGIIKTPENGREGICITTRQDKAAEDVLASACKKHNTRLIVAQNPQSPKPDSFYEVFDYTSSQGIHIKNVKCGISGAYQPENACLAIECALSLGISPENIVRGITRAKNPARFEIISEKPLVIYDGAHNKNGMAALTASLKRYLPHWQGAVFITAFMGDKDVKGAFSELENSGLLEKSSVYAVTVKGNPRALTPMRLSKVLREIGIPSTPFESLKDAYLDAISRSLPVILCGSLYLYKDFDEVLKSIDK